MEIKLDRTIKDGVVIIDIIGNIRTNDDYSIFKRAIDDSISDGNVRIVLNFNDVGFINSSGLGRLVLAAKKAKEMSGNVAVTNLSADLKELLSFTRLDSKLQIFDTAEEATAHFNS
jgi:anti-sigma B factor antagonist